MIAARARGDVFPTWWHERIAAGHPGYRWPMLAGDRAGNPGTGDSSPSLPTPATP